MLIITLLLDFYPASQRPGYWQANVTNVAFSAACIALATTLRFCIGWRNKTLDQAGDDDSAEGATKVTALAQRWQCHPECRYTL
jgi:hypothetical protein